MIKLSASKIKTLDTCSFLYHCQYVLKLPRVSNTGANLGTITHSVLEFLQNERHKKHLIKINENNTCKSSPAICRYIKFWLKKFNEKLEEIDTIDQFLKVALSTDFLIKDFKLGEPEFKFEINNENPKYSIIGFIDQYAIKDDIIKIKDFKTQKRKFTKGEMEYNVQAMLYLVAAKKLWPNLKRGFVNFIMLRFKKDPVQIASYSDEKLKGFELYLEYLDSYLSEWSYDKAISNFAAENVSKKMLCGKEPNQFKEDGSKVWCCAYKRPFKYFALLDCNGQVIKSEFDKEDLKPKNGEVVKEMQFSGCPYWNKN